MTVFVGSSERERLRVASEPPLVSIITIVLNDRLGLSLTMASVREQSFQDLEWLIIDGGSTDGTLDDIMGSKPSSTIIVSEPDRGICDAMNKGLNLAKGVFVMFLNAGDTFAGKDTLARLGPWLRDGGVDFVYGDKIDRKDGRMVYTAAGTHHQIFYGMFGCHQAMYYRRSVIGSLRYDTRLKVSGDYDFTARFLRKTDKIKKMQEALCIFDEPATSLKHHKLGRAENWVVQRDVLGLSLGRRLLIRCVYHIMFLTLHHVPFLYHWLKSWRSRS